MNKTDTQWIKEVNTKLENYLETMEVENHPYNKGFREALSIMYTLLPNSFVMEIKKTEPQLIKNIEAIVISNKWK